MFKRIMALVLCLLMLAAVLPVGVSAEETEAGQLRRNITSHYYRTLSIYGGESLKGLCGGLASYQLYFLGVNSYPVMADGKNQYDLYAEKSYTDTGYQIRSYSAQDYTLEEALNAITHGGTWNAYNILIGFQTTDTEAGSQFGHAVVIYGIIDGMVYFTESYSTTYVGAAGNPGVCTISQFAELYDCWAQFEGAILFGRRDYLDNCCRHDANMYVQVQREDPLYTQPCVPDTDEVESHIIRTARKGEFLYVTAMYENSLGRYYYQVQDGDTICYLDAQRAEPVRFNTEDVVFSDAELPQVLTPGKDFTVKGKVSSQNSAIGAVTMNVTDSTGEVIMTHSRAKISGTFDLAKDTFNKVLDFGILEEGLYTYTLTADVLSDYLLEGAVETNLQQVTLCSVQFAVGEGIEIPQQEEAAPRAAQDGWVMTEGVWRYYEQGEPRTGWFCYAGVDYYLQEDGSAAVGWVQINGKDRYFTANGAMCTGWLHTQEGSWYLLKNGQKAIGWRTVEEQQYCFDENGLMLCGGWTELEEGIFCFQEEGTLLAQATVDGETVTYEKLTEAEVEIPPLHEETE
ncbi:MAG: hypothetical protein IKK41_05590 [Oscillospiraceae bacterium]|nr:hypothetical protein [Oscillospiraceae bacterium]MBR4109765.1 hypothetical protein [Oscillospiraceae bacterium]